MTGRDSHLMHERIAVIGLGYVGLPVAFARHFPDTVGFDIDVEMVAELCRGHDRNGETSPEVLRATALRVTADTAALRDRTFIVVGLFGFPVYL